MSFTVYVVISLNEKAVDGNTVSIPSQLSKSNLPLQMATFRVPVNEMCETH